MDSYAFAVAFHQELMYKSLAKQRHGKVMQVNESTIKRQHINRLLNSLATLIRGRQAA